VVLASVYCCGFFDMVFLRRPARYVFPLGFLPGSRFYNPFLRGNLVRQRSSCREIYRRVQLRHLLSHTAAMTIGFVLLRNRFAQWSVSLALAAALPLLMYHLIEHPGIQAGKKIANWLWESPART